MQLRRHSEKNPKNKKQGKKEGIRRGVIRWPVLSGRGRTGDGSTVVSERAY